MTQIGFLALIVAGTALVVVRRIAARRRKSRGEWIAECPATETTAEITLDAAGGVTGCSHWPERERCDQSCVR